MYEHVVTLSIRTRSDQPGDWDWTTLLDLDPEEGVTVVDAVMTAEDSFEQEE